MNEKFNPDKLFMLQLNYTKALEKQVAEGTSKIRNYLYIMNDGEARLHYNKYKDRLDAEGSFVDKVASALQELEDYKNKHVEQFV